VDGVELGSINDDEVREGFDGVEPIYYAACSVCGKEYYLGTACDVVCESKPYCCRGCFEFSDV
jgi:hypothetical protein